MAPNPSYGGPTLEVVPTLQAIPYTSDTAEFNAVLSHSIDIGYMPQTDVPQLSAVKAAGYHVFGYPDWGFDYVNYNFADKTGDFNNIISQLYVRQALAHLEDEEGYVKAFFHGAGGARVRAGSRGADVAVHPRERAEEPVSRSASARRPAC